MAKKGVDLKFLAAGILAACACAFLIHLGMWQLERLRWKEGMIAQIDAQKAVDPKTVALGRLTEDAVNNFKRGYLTGLWMPGKTMRVGPRMLNGALGYWIVTPFVLNDGTIILVNRGWTEEKMAGLLLDSTPTQGVVTLTGTLRMPEASIEDPGPIAGNEQWWHEIDPNRMGQQLHFERPARLIFFEDGSTPADDAVLKPAPVVAELRNEHKNYAIFWFTMAGLVVLLFLGGAVWPRIKPKQQKAASLPKKR